MVRRQIVPSILLLVLILAFGWYVDYLLRDEIISNLRLAIRVVAYTILALSIIAGLFAFLWIREEFYTRQAKRRQAEREADVYAVVSEQHGVFVREMNTKAIWRPLHLNVATHQNGQPAEPTPVEMAVYQFYHRRGSKAVETSPAPLMIEAPAPVLPDRVDLVDYLHQPSLRSIFLGLSVSGHQLTEVRAPIWQLVHIANGGATDSGKSNMERAIAYQVSLADNVQTIFVDLKRQTFKPFYNSDRLLYPIIKDVQDFTACLGELRGETERRLRLFEKELTLETIHDYNRVVPEPLPYIVMFVDEMSNLFTHKGAHNQFLELIRISRAAGIYIVAAGQSWSHRTLSPDTRQQFRTAFHFATNDAYSSRMLLNDGRATGIEVQGRAFASLPFGLAKDVIEVQTPFLDLQTVAETLGGGGKSILDLPVRVVNEGEPGESADDMFVRLVRGGTKRTEASLIAFKKVYSGNHVTYCKRLLGEV